MTNTITPLVNPSYEPTDQRSLRFSAAPWFETAKNVNVLVAGCGGIGSWLTFMLSRIRPASIRVIDPDTVDSTNLGGQLFSSAMVDMSKVEATSEFCQLYSAYWIDAISGVLTMNSEVPPVCFGCFDNMEARRVLYECWARQVESSDNPNYYLLIDGRLSAEVFQVFCMAGTDSYYRKQYEEKWLFPDSEAEGTVCSYKQTSYCANMIASVMTNCFVNWIVNSGKPLIDRALPFMLEYNAEQMFLKTEV